MNHRAIKTKPAEPGWDADIRTIFPVILNEVKDLFVIRFFAFAQNDAAFTQNCGVRL
jgi:hypothetical protein